MVLLMEDVITKILNVRMICLLYYEGHCLHDSNELARRVGEILRYLSRGVVYFSRTSEGTSSNWEGLPTGRQIVVM